MDNFCFNIVSEGKANFILAMGIAFSKCKTTTHYWISKEKGLVLLWAKPEGSKNDIQPLPYLMTVKVATEFAWNWLEQDEYGPEPDHDGSNRRGWMVYNEEWGFVDNQREAIVAIKPVWAMYGK